MITHYIYEVVGRKVGCTKNPKKRLAVYEEMEGVIPTIRIVDELHDKTDQEAGDIEWEWADKLGYARGGRYAIVMIGARERSRRGNAAISPERKIEIMKKAGRRRNEVLSPERKSEIGRAAGTASAVARKGTATGFAAMSPERFREVNQKARARSAELRRGVAFKRSTCPHCGFIGGGPTMHRWHFDNCSRKKA